MAFDAIKGHKRHTKMRKPAALVLLAFLALAVPAHPQRTCDKFAIFVPGKDVLQCQDDS
jgi:hypothetical protein